MKHFTAKTEKFILECPYRTFSHILSLNPLMELWRREPPGRLYPVQMFWMAVSGTHSYGLGGVLLWAVLVENTHAQGLGEKEKALAWGVSYN